MCAVKLCELFFVGYEVDVRFGVTGVGYGSVGGLVGNGG